MTELTATVVGGGIAGLTTAVALARAGWRTTVLERSPTMSEVGAGLALPRNGIAALRGIGFDDEAIRRVGHETLGTGFRDLRGRWLLRVPEDEPDVRWAITVWGVHRQRLHSALKDAAERAGVELVVGATVTGVSPGSADGDRAIVTWRTDVGESTGTASRDTDLGKRLPPQQKSSDLVVGADGIWSAVRAQLFPDVRPRYSGSTSWRAVVPNTTFDGRLVELWGPEAEFGAMRVSDTELYWYGYFRHPAGARFDDELAAAHDRFAGWHPQVRRLIEATTPAQLMRHDVYHLPGGLPTYTRGRVVMVGDAAHAALPTMGQGAATALEDGVSVGRLIGMPVAAGGDLGRALAGFEAARRPRCSAIARQSVLMARFGADLQGGWRQTVRNSAMQLVPGRLVTKAGVPLVSWVPAGDRAPDPGTSGGAQPGAARYVGDR